jgi:chromatin remodeling complex protein RSC6
MNASTMTIKGTVDSKDLIECIKKETRKNAEVVIPKKQKDQNQNQKDQNQNQKGQNKNQKGQNQNQKGQNKNQNDGEEMDNKKKDDRNIGLSYPNDPSGLVYATEILSDENPNACSIM